MDPRRADVIGAFVAEMDFGAAPAVEAALRDVIARGDFGYLSEHSIADMADAYAAWQQGSYGWTVDSARIRPLPDVIKGQGGGDHGVLSARAAR